MLALRAARGSGPGLRPPFDRASVRGPAAEATGKRPTGEVTEGGGFPHSKNGENNLGARGFALSG